MFPSGFPDWGHQLKIKIRAFKVTKTVRMSLRICANPWTVVKEFEVASHKSVGYFPIED